MSFAIPIRKHCGRALCFTVFCLVGQFYPNVSQSKPYTEYIKGSTAILSVINAMNRSINVSQPCRGELRSPAFSSVIKLSFERILIDVLPYLLIIPFIANNFVVERFLPNGISDLFGYGTFELFDDPRYGGCSFPTTNRASMCAVWVKRKNQKNEVDVVWHNAILINHHIAVNRT